jgi:hypothetical protein
MEPAIVFRDPVQLKPLSDIKDFPRWNREDPRFMGLCDDIRDNGIRHPLQITGDDYVIDGETRRLVAKILGLKEVPCIIASESEVDEIIIRELVRRRNLTKGQLAFLVAPHLQKAFDESRNRMLSGKRSNPDNSVCRVQTNPSDSVGRVQTIKEYGVLMGFSVDLLEQARRLHAHFEADQVRRTMTDSEGVTEEGVTLEEFFKPRLFRDHKPYGLGAVLAGIASMLDAEAHPNHRGGGKPKDLSRQLQLFERVLLTDAMNRWEYWQSCGEEEKAGHFARVRTKAATLPQDQCEEMAEYHSRLAQEFRKAAKRQQEGKTSE